MCKNGKLANFETGPHVVHSQLSHKSLKVKKRCIKILCMSRIQFGI